MSKSHTSLTLILAVCAACVPDDLDELDEPELAGFADDAPDAPQTLADPADPTLLTSGSFTFQHPLTGSQWTHSCDFNDLDCYTPGKYHTALDESASTSVSIRASNFGVRSLIQSMSANDHGMGNAVAVRYLLDNGQYIFATDNHMSSHHPLSSRPDGAVVVPRGTKLGNVGGSGYGLPTKYGAHDHHEMKTVNSFAASNGAYWGYTPQSATNYGYQDPGNYFTSRRVLVPEFSTTNSGWGDYDVLYGVVGAPVYAQIKLVNATEKFTLAGVGGRAGWSASVSDFPLQANVGPGTATVTQSRTFIASGDYRFNAAVQAGNEWRAGFPVIFTVLPKSADFIRDNDMASTYFTSGGLGIPRFDGYAYGANAATGNSGAWARWYARRSGAYRLWAYVGGNGIGSVRFKIYPTGVDAPIWSDPVNLSTAVYGWVQIKAGATTSWNFTTDGYIGLAADTGAASEVYLFDAIKFTAL